MRFLTRYTGLASVGGAVLSIIMIADWALTGLTVLAPDVLPQAFAGLGFSEDIRQRVMGAEFAYRDGQVGDDEHLAAIFGLSGASEGIELAIVAEHDEIACRYLGLARAGRNLEDVFDYALPVIESDLYPDLVILAISPFHLVDASFNKNGQPGNIPDIDEPGLFVPQRPAPLAGRLWVHRRREDISHVIDRQLMQARYRFMRRLGFRPREFTVDPWAEMPKLDAPESSTEAYMEWAIQRYGLRGYYDEQAYRASTCQAAAFAKTIQVLRDRHSHVIVVLMPEHEALRKRIPPFAMDRLREVVAFGSGSDSPVVVDMRAAIGADGFIDISHVNSRGRRAFSKQLAAVVREQLPRQPPLMTGVQLTHDGKSPR